MFLTKLRRKESGILIYGITPPKSETPIEKVQAIAVKSLNILRSLEIDALVIYDVQEEAERTSEERPFPFASAMDPLEYTSKYLEPLDVPKIIYRTAGKHTHEELAHWLRELKEHDFHPVFVGLPTPDYVPKTTLPEAYRIWHEHRHDHSVIGAVTIPERHAILKDEHVRMFDKVDGGVSYFISQCIFDIDCTRQMLDDLVVTGGQRKQHLPTIIFTLTICGSLKTLQFLEWLGIHIPRDMKEEFKTSANLLARSSEITLSIAKDLIKYCRERSVPFGFNIESVATRKEEVDASLELLKAVRELLTENGLRSRNGHVFAN